MTQGNAKNRETKQKGYVFTVEVLIEDQSNSLALEKMIHMLNSNQVKDYRITRGIEMGSLIEANVNYYTEHLEAGGIKEIRVGLITDQIKDFIVKGTLIRLKIIKEKGIRLNIPCRILKYDESNDCISVYHVDEKKVYLFGLNEIEDFVVH